jgi:hypothetical protein
MAVALAVTSTRCESSIAIQELQYQLWVVGEPKRPPYSPRKVGDDVVPDDSSGAEFSHRLYKSFVEVTDRLAVTYWGSKTQKYSSVARKVDEDAEVRLFLKRDPAQSPPQNPVESSLDAGVGLFQ